MADVIPEGNTARLKRLLEDQGAFDSFYQNPSFGRHYDPNVVAQPAQYRRGNAGERIAVAPMGDLFSPYSVGAPPGGRLQNLRELWNNINARDVAARLKRNQNKTLSVYQRAFFSTFPHYLPYHEQGYPIRLTFEERELWNRVKPRSRKIVRRRRAPARRAPYRRRAGYTRKRTYRRRA